MRNLDFDDVGKLDKPNLDWDATLALKETRESLRLAYVNGDIGKMHFIGAVEALLDSTIHYWFLDTTFEGKIKEIEADLAERLKEIPEGQMTDENGVSRITLLFNAARLKYRQIMMSITKVTKDVPYVDTA